jgi:intein/homing endonuclease
MAFSKYANAVVAKPVVSLDAWRDLQAKSLGSSFNSKQAQSKLFVQKYDPGQYLLSHCTIIASVDTENGPGALGKVLEGGFQVNRNFANYYITPNTSKFINSNCFVPGTMILMGDGTEKPIELVEVGDSVISHTGTIRKVTETFRKPFKGELQRIVRLGDSRPLEVTPEHPFWAMVPPSICSCGCGEAIERRQYKAALHRFKDLKYGHQFRGRTLDKPHYDWVPAKQLSKGDFLAYPRLKGSLVEEGITPGKAKLIGYFLAEGFYYKQKAPRISQAKREKFGLTKDSPNSIPVSVSFALNLDEVDTLAKEIRILLKQEFGIGSSFNQVSPNGITVYSRRSYEAVKFFQTYCGSGSHNKRLDPRVLTWPLDLQKLLVQAYFEGDGCVQKRHGGWLYAVTASEALASQMHVLLTRLGAYATRTKHTTHGRKRLRSPEGSVSIVNDYTKTCTAYSVQVGATHAKELVEGSFLEAPYNEAIASVKPRKSTLNYRITPEAAIFPVRSFDRLVISA